MFSLAKRLAASERARRAICRLLFVFGCFFPTVGVLLWCAAHYLPGQVEQTRRQLAHQLGLEVGLHAVRYPRPGVMLLEGLTLAEPEFGRPLLSIDELEITVGGEQVTLSTPQAEAESAGLRQLWRLLQRRLQSRTPRKIHLRAAQVACRQGGTLHSLVDVQARVETSAASAQAVVAWRLAGRDMQQPQRIGLVRNRTDGTASTQWQLETGATPLPCPVAAALLPDAARLGETSEFCGTLWAQQTPEGWIGALSGRFENVDLPTALGKTFPHPVTGTAELRVERATFRHGRLELLQADLLAEGGTYGRSLVAAAVQHLGMQLTTQRELLPEAEPYRELGLRVVLNGSGLSIRGLCASAPGAVLVSRWGPVLREPPQVLQSTGALLKLVSASPPALLPISREAEPLARVLPLPATPVRR